MFLVRSHDSGQLEWMELTDPHQRIKPFHFEIFFGKESLRDEHYEQALERAAGKKTVLVRELFGFWDLSTLYPPKAAGRVFYMPASSTESPPTGTPSRVNGRSFPVNSRPAPTRTSYISYAWP